MQNTPEAYLAVCPSCESDGCWALPSWREVGQNMNLVAHLHLVARSKLPRALYHVFVTWCSCSGIIFKFHHMKDGIRRRGLDRVYLHHNWDRRWTCCPWL